jgi:hypothetical protein
LRRCGKGGRGTDNLRFRKRSRSRGRRGFILSRGQLSLLRNLESLLFYLNLLKSRGFFPSLAGFFLIQGRLCFSGIHQGTTGV